MTYSQKAPMSAADVIALSEGMLVEAAALGRIGAGLAEIEAATGRKFALVEDGAGVEYDRAAGRVEVTVTRDRDGMPMIHSRGGMVPMGPIRVPPHIEQPYPFPQDPDRINGLIWGRACVDVPLASMGPKEGAQPAQEPPLGGKSPDQATVTAESKGDTSAASTAPARVTPKSRRSDAWADLTIAERRIVEHVEALPEGWEPADDLHLVEMLARGEKLDLIAEFLGIDGEACKDRWEAMVRQNDVKSATSKGPSLMGQARLLVALRYRVKEAANAA